MRLPVGLIFNAGGKMADDKKFKLGNKAKDLLIYSLNCTNGFPKSTGNTYIKTIQDSCVNIVSSIQTANDCRFESECEKRLELINEVIKKCNLMLQLINISLGLNHIDIKRSKQWAKMVSDIKYMALAWEKKEAERAEVLRKNEKANDYSSIAHLIATEMRAYLRASRRRMPTHYGRARTLSIGGK